MRTLDRLLNQAIDPAFTGHVAVEVHAIEGRLEAVISGTKRRHRKDD